MIKDWYCEGRRVAITGYKGYIGSALYNGLKEFDCDVTCVDIDQKKIDSIINGEIPIFEPGLSKIVKGNMKKRNLIF